MAEVLDIIQKIQIEADTDVVEQLNAEFGTSIKQIQASEKAIASYQNQLNKTSADETRKRQVLTQLIDRQKQAIDRVNTSIGKQLADNPKLSNSLVDVTGKLRNLSFAGSQLLREAPAFTFSLQTGILALSNNIPILLDQLKSARAEGATATNIFKALGSSIFSLSGLITIGVAALAIFGDQIFDTGKKSADTAKDIQEVTKAIQEQAKAATQSVIAERNRLNIGENQARRELDQAKARGASEEEILQLQRRVSDERSNTARNELARLEVIEDATRTNYQFFSELYQNDEYVRELTAKNIQKTLRETLGITKEAAEEEAVAIANSYNTRESIIGKYRLRKRELEETIKDEANTVVTEELALDRQQRERYTKQYEDFINRRLALIQFLKDRVKEAANELGADLLQAIEEFERNLKNRQEGLINGFKNFPINQDTSGLFGSSLGLPEGEASQLRDLLRDQKIRDNIAKENADKEKIRIKELKSERKDAQDDFITGIDISINAINRLLDAQINALDQELAARERNIQQAQLLAERGNTEILRQETERIQQVQSERERAAKQQIQLNAVVEASNQAVAVSEAIGAIVAAAAKGDPYTIALRIGAAVAALVAGIATIKGAFKDGVVDYKGAGTGTSDSNVVRISRGESVITAKATQQYKPMLEAMNKGNFNPSIYMPATVDRTDELINAVGQNRTEVHAKITGGEFVLLTQKHSRRMARGFRG